MVAQSKITKYPLYCIRVGVRADFQDFVMVGEHRGFHNMTVLEREEIGDGKCRCIRAFLGASVAVMSEYGAESARHLGPAQLQPCANRPMRGVLCGPTMFARIS